jgi:hypothetical protein
MFPTHDPYRYMTELASLTRTSIADLMTPEAAKKIWTHFEKQVDENKHSSIAVAHGQDPSTTVVSTTNLLSSAASPSATTIPVPSALNSQEKSAKQEKNAEEQHTKERVAENKNQLKQKSQQPTSTKSSIASTENLPSTKSFTNPFEALSLLEEEGEDDNFDVE